MIIIKLQIILVSSSWGTIRKGGGHYILARPVTIEDEQWDWGQNLEEYVWITARLKQ